MIRMFKEHTVRRQEELEGLWDFVKTDKKELPEEYTQKIYVPSCWESNPGYENYRGFGVFNKTIFLDAKSDLRFVFKGVSHTADVYFDKKHIAHHYNAYTEFSALVLNAEAGEHVLEVIVDNTFGEHSALHISNDYYTYGGITRPVVMQCIAHGAYIEYMHFEPYQENGAWKSRINLRINNISASSKKVGIALLLDGVELDVECADKQFEIPANSSIDISLNASYEDFNIKQWDMLDANLYLLRANLIEKSAVIDDMTQRVGFRTIETRGAKILLNGEEVFMKGFNRHEDHSDMGCAIPTQTAETDIKLMLDMGANSVRTCHYPNDERFLDLCDEYGILVWEESHARGLTIEDMRNPNFDKQSEDCINEMVLNHYNHPSIIVWGILNECESATLEGKEKYEKQFEQIKSLDKSRPLTFATCRHFKDICLDLVDIVSVNLYFGWYGTETTLDATKKSFEEYLQWIDSTEGAGKPLIVSEFGAGALYGMHSTYNLKWSEEKQCEVIEHTLETYLNHPKVSGALIWQFCDCKVSEGKWSNFRPRTYNNKGVVDEYRRPKMAYKIVKNHFTKS